MKVNLSTPIVFQRRLKSGELPEYQDVLKQARDLAAGGIADKNVLIVPATSLPQTQSNNTGVGNLGSKESMKFFDFAKKYWGINEIQLLPTGQYHKSRGIYPMYSGTSMDFGSQMIDIKTILSKSDFKKLVEQNKISDRVNFSNVIESTSKQEKLLKELYEYMPSDLFKEFIKFKEKNASKLEPKSLFYALCEYYETHDTKQWGKIDANLYDESVVSLKDRLERLNSLRGNSLITKSSDFYLFKQFLAEKSFLNAKKKLNDKGIKVSGDMICGFSADEVWANPKAFVKDSTIGWGLPALDFRNPEAEELLRKKVDFYARHFDGFRVDAAWTYDKQIIRYLTKKEFRICDWQDRFIKIIEDEVKKVKGNNYDLKNITWEFTADSSVYSMFNKFELKPHLKNRVKILTSDYLTQDWGSSQVLKERGWDPKYFIIGAANHDSHSIEYTQEQAEILGKLLKIPAENLKKYSEFLKAKFAEPFSGKNVMLFFMNALGMKGQFKDNPDAAANYTAKIPADYEEFYHNALQKGEAFNPMDALEKQFVAQGLDKQKPELFRKIQKYRKILEEAETRGKNNKTAYIIAAAIVLISITALILWKVTSNKKENIQK